MDGRVHCSNSVLKWFKCLRTVSITSLLKIFKIVLENNISGVSPPTTFGTNVAWKKGEITSEVRSSSLSARRQAGNNENQCHFNGIEFFATNFQYTCNVQCTLFDKFVGKFYNFFNKLLVQNYTAW